MHRLRKDQNMNEIWMLVGIVAAILFWWLLNREEKSTGFSEPEKNREA